MKGIVIIGGGFSGTIAAVNLGRLSRVPLRISIIDNNSGACRGIAYNTRNSSHLLNVAARNMSALADQPNHFVEWLMTRADHLDEPVSSLREQFMPRRVYGEYLHSLFLWTSALLAEEKKMMFERVADEAEQITIDGQHALVRLGRGRTIAADKIILALGNQPPTPYRLRGLDARSPKYIGDPWLGWESKLPPKDRDLLIIGTGLTAVDTILSLQDAGWQGKIHAVSRNGWLPLPHFKGMDYPDWGGGPDRPARLREFLALFHYHYREVKARGINPAILVDKLRPHTQRIWQDFSVGEKRQFNRHLRTRWNVARHRIAPEIHKRLQDSMANGQLQVMKGRLRQCEESEDALRLSVESNGVQCDLKVGAVINCTGPQENYLPSSSNLLNDMLAQGLIEPDEMNMGIKVSPNFAVVDCMGRASKLIHAIGSIMKGTLWETLAVPELRSQAFRLAETICRQFHTDDLRISEIAEVTEPVMEYCI